MFGRKSKEEKIQLTPQEIMDKIIDKTLLKTRNKTNIKKTDEGLIKITKEDNDDEKNLPWWRKEINEEDFTIYKYKNKFYAQHKDWDKEIYIGAYDSLDIVKDVIQKEYAEDSRLPLLQRSLDTSRIHSVIIKNAKMEKIK